MRLLAQLAAVVGSLLLAACFALLVLAIWTIGDDSSRFVGTALLAALVGVPLVGVGGTWLSDNPRRLS